MMFSLAGIAWLARPTRPNVAAMEESAIASGTSDATSDARTSIRTMIVSGIEIMPALPRPAHLLVERLVRRRADGLERHAGVTGVDLVDRCGQLVDVLRDLLVCALGHVLDHRRATILRDETLAAGAQWRAHLRHLGEGGERRLRVLDFKGHHNAARYSAPQPPPTARSRPAP